MHVQIDRVTKMRPPRQLAEFDKHGNKRLEALCRALRMLGLQTQSALRCGIPFKEALAVADEMNVSLIVLGSRRHSAVREMLADSTFENVARLSRQPVLVVRPQKKPGEA